MALANFNNAKAAELQPHLDKIWAEPSTYKSYAPKAHTLKTVLENQTAQLSLLEDPSKLNEVSVKWVDFCGDTSTASTYDSDCTNTLGNEGAAKKQNYSLDYFREDSFGVATEELERSVLSYNEIVATGLANKTKNLVEQFNKHIVSVIALNKGVNPYAGGFSYNALTKDTTIPAASYGGRNIIPYFMQVTEMNKSQEVFMLDGGNLFTDYYIADKTTVDSNGKTTANMYSDIAFKHDMAGFAANSLNNNTFLIDKGAIAIANRAKFTSLEQLVLQGGDGWTHTSTGSYMRYSIPINLPDLMPMMFVAGGKMVKQKLMLDVQYSTICQGAKEYANWKLKLSAGVFVNPIRCNTDNTGILSFVKGA